MSCNGISIKRWVILTARDAHSEFYLFDVVARSDVNDEFIDVIDDTFDIHAASERD